MSTAEPQPPTQVMGEPDGPNRPWWQRGWGVAAIGVVGLLVGAGIGASGKGTTKTVTNEAAASQQAKVPAETVTVNHTRTVVHLHTHTVTAASEPSEPSAESSSAGGGKTYSGNGSKSLGTVEVSQPSTIHWHAAGGLFGMDGCTDPCEHTIGISSQASSGESAVEPGTYKEVSVASSGEWSISISPG